MTPAAAAPVTLDAATCELPPAACHGHGAPCRVPRGVAARQCTPVLAIDLTYVYDYST